MMINRLGLLAVTAALGVSSPTLALNTTFAQFTQASPSRIVSDTTTGASNIMSVTDAPVFFVVQAFGPVGIYSALLNIAAASPAMVTDTGPQFEQVGWSGSYSFTNGGVNYLTVAFNNAITDINGNGGSGSMFATDPSNSISYSSDIIDVSGFLTKDFALAFSAVTPPFAIGADGFGTPFTANIAGTFAGTVPEPATWAMLVMGFGLSGLALRKRRPNLLTVSA